MDLDHANFGWRVVCVENCEPIKLVTSAPTVYVDANFLIPSRQQGVDGVFPRFAYMDQMYEASKRCDASKRAKGPPLNVPVPPTNPSLRPYRPPDYAAEWKMLRKAWSLARNSKTNLSAKQIALGSAQFYLPEHQLNNLENWVWRLASLLCTPRYDLLFDNALSPNFAHILC
jgi:hypothetical protein